MSTIASPRPSTSLQSPASSRTSQEFPKPPRPPNQRRNRTALRDYYGLKATEADPSQTLPTEPSQKDGASVSELDRDGFDAAAYVKDALAREGLEGVLRIEGELISGTDSQLLIGYHNVTEQIMADSSVDSEIKNLDGERKALVYDNYSKLIAATDTIRKVTLDSELVSENL